ncbi:PQQ-binding-like beta-propeller repeat protein [Nocardioides anomalus]|uniref:PQQ-binding-like beta-propeller repeat protein n=1 Tax=Nocardioides anomalus TaxID=2712223 RepID=A0A6G6WHN1_9ACTN|nr:PQQ-like beta-propeller repeat protein [Nocardioides anomalus]QIG44570.1 PQQ-binding-like beta-propeller repeat protein [Nocardioides anomalus]
MATTRAIVGWLPALVLVPALAAAAVVVSVPDDDVAAMREEQPLDLGTTWVYDVTDHGQPSGTRTSQVAASASLIDDRGLLVPTVKVTARYTDYPGTGPRRYDAYYRVDGDSVYQYAQDEGGTWYAISPRIPSYRLPAEPGLSWDYDGTVGDADYSSRTELTEVGDIEASGRTFTGCAHFVTHTPVAVEGQPDAERTFDEWTCPGYGTVKTRDHTEATDSDVTEELTQFHGVAHEWYAAGHDPEPVAATDVPGSTYGFGAGRTFAAPDGTLGRDLAWTDGRGESGLHPPVSDGEVMVLAEADGGVTLRTVGTGEVRWRVRLRGPVLAAPVLADGAVVVADPGKQVTALSLDDGRALWVRRLPDVVSASPVVVGDQVVVPTDDGAVTALSLTDGTTAWSTTLGGPARTALAADAEHVLVADDSGTLTALDPDDGDADWSSSFDSGVRQGPVVAEGHVLVQDGDGVVHAFDADGDVDWQTRGREEGAWPLAAGDGVLVTVDLHDLRAYDLDDGHRLWTREVAPQRTTVAVIGDEVVASGTAGQVEVLGLADGEVRDRWTLPTLAPGDRWFNDVAPALVGDDLVLTGSANGTTDTVLFAYPVRDGAAAGGVSLRVDLRDVPGYPNEAAALAGDDVLVPVGQDLVAVGPDDASRTVQTGDVGVQTTPVVAGDVVVSRNGKHVEARRLDDGTQLWELPSGDPEYGASPATDGTTVVYAHTDGVLVAADLRTGDVRWTAPLDGQNGSSQPLLLPDGDVVYGGGGLARYDGATGDVRWRDPATHLLGPAAYAGGTVYAAGYDPATNEGRLVAVDAATGERRWSVPLTLPPLYLGPAVGAGVVVAYDGPTAHAYDATTGDELWTLTGSRPAAGGPAVVDGRVLLVQRGNNDDLEDDEYRLSVQDARTGRLLAAWEAPGTPPGRTALTAVTPDGRLLMPSLGLAVVQVVP